MLIFILLIFTLPLWLVRWMSIWNRASQDTGYFAYIWLICPLIRCLYGGTTKFRTTNSTWYFHGIGGIRTHEIVCFDKTLFELSHSDLVTHSVPLRKLKFTWVGICLVLCIAECLFCLYDKHIVIIQIIREDKCKLVLRGNSSLRVWPEIRMALVWF